MKTNSILEKYKLALGLTVALIAFAANSVLTRQALDQNTITPELFTLIRLGSGAFLLLWLVRSRLARIQWATPAGIAGSVSLLAYALGFTFAYQHLEAGLGALILFGFVQLSLLSIGMYRGEPFGWQQAIASVLALSGLGILVGGNLTLGNGNPAFLGAASLMALAGIAWGIQTALGKTSKTPLDNMARNFAAAGVLALPFLLPSSFQSISSVTPTGIGLALASGTLASGLGYVVWYWVLPQIQTQFAGLAQLSVPLITAVAGLALLNEPIGWRFKIAAFLILGGIAIALIATPKVRQKR